MVALVGRRCRRNQLFIAFFIPATTTLSFLLLLSSRCARAFPTTSVRCTQQRIAQQSHLHQSLTSILNNDYLEEEEEGKWERMYQEGATSRRNPFSFADEMEAASSTGDSSKSPIRLITFDVDNTLWRTGPTIAAANDVLATHMKETLMMMDSQNNEESPILVRVESIMGDLFRGNKERYCPIDPEKAKGPTNLTLLRKDAIRQLLEEHMDDDDNESNCEKMVDHAFDVWVKARYDSITDHLVPGALECLDAIQSLKTTNGSGSDSLMMIGAITDGNSNPMDMPLFAPYFSFVINAERVGVSKPDARVYLQAAKTVAAQPDFQDLFEGCSLSDDSVDDDNLEAIEQRIGSWWVHVGDDFIKDIVAAKGLGIRTVWSRELVLDKLRANDGKDDDEPQKPQRSLEEFVKEISSQAVVKMQIGPTDYLLDSMHREFADEVIDNFSSLAGVVRSWHEEGQVMSSVVEPPFVEDDLEIVAADPAPKAAAGREESDSAAVNTKYCIACGTKLPITAKFCSSCGEKQ